MKTAIVGCGVMGKTHASAYEAKGAKVIAVCDQDADRAAQFAALFHCTGYSSLKKLFEEQTPDLISLCTPASNHLESIELACENKCAVLCEKPFVVDMVQAQRAGELIVKSGIPFRIGFKMRYENVYAAAQEIVASGEIGKLRYAFISHFQPLSEPAWYMDIGITTELLIHSFDIFGWLFDELPQEILMKSSYLLGKSGEDQSMVELCYTDNRKAVVVGGYMPGFPPVRGKHDFVFQFIGECGYVAGKRNGAVEVFSPRRIETMKPAECNAFEKEIEDMLKAVSGLKTAGAGLKDALRSQMILAAAKRSEKTGRIETVS